MFVFPLLYKFKGRCFSTEVELPIKQRAGLLLPLFSTIVSEWFSFSSLPLPQNDRWCTNHHVYIPGREKKIRKSKNLHSTFLLLQFSRSVVSDSLWPHEPPHARSPSPSPTPGVYSNSCPLSWWYHQTISSSVIPFSSRLQSFPESGSFPISQFFASVGQSIRASASASVLPMNNQDWFPSRWTSWVFLQSEGVSRVFSNTTVQKHQFSLAIKYSNIHLYFIEWNLVTQVQGRLGNVVFTSQSPKSL